ASFSIVELPTSRYMHSLHDALPIWQIATLGVAYSTIVHIIPWSLGLTETVDVLLTRTLFWYFGHPLVYFWLLPAYMMWYAILPRSEEHTSELHSRENIVCRLPLEKK